jgi:hypothetical protein
VQQLVALLLVIWQYLFVLFLKVCRRTSFEWFSSDRHGSGSIIQHQCLLATLFLDSGNCFDASTVTARFRAV